MKLKFFSIMAAALLLSSCGSANSQTTSDPKADTTGSEQEAPAKRTVKPDTLTFTFVGDVMPGTTYPESPKGAYLPANGGRDLFKDVRTVLQGADVAFGNLEGSMMTGGTPGKKCSNPNTCFIFRIPPEMAEVLADEGFDMMNMANNHAHDFGEAGINTAISSLEKYGVKTAGIKDKMPTAIIERDGLKIGLIGFSTSGKGIPLTQYEKARELIKDLASKVDITVVSMHAGAEGVQYDRVPKKDEYFLGENRGDVYKFAHNAIDAGADVVWGHGPHVPRGMELYKDKLIMYSLGNFCTPYRMKVAGDTGLAPLVEMKIDSNGNFVEGQIHSLRQTKGVGPRTDASNEAARKIKKLSTLDFANSPLKISDSGKLSK